MKKAFTILIATICFAFPSISIGEVFYAWWVTAELIPKGVKIEGIPINLIDNNWAHASVLCDELLPPEANNPNHSVQSHGLSFIMKTKLDNKSINEHSMVGVYEKYAGVRGRFLLITAEIEGGKRIIKALFQLDGANNFSALFYNSKINELAWWSCMECDGVSIIKFHDKKYILEFPEEP